MAGAPQFIAFLDMLGTTSQVKMNRYGLIDSLDFANPVGIAAHLFPNTRSAVFSDCIIVSCSVEHTNDFVRALGFMYGQWYADYILVRGGISVGEINWVDHQPSDSIFSALQNFTCTRVYGKGLIAAYELENRSLPGALCYIDEKSSELLSAKNNNYVVHSKFGSRLVTTEKNQLKHRFQFFHNSAQSTDSEIRKKHLDETAEYFRSLIKINSGLENDFIHGFDMMAAMQTTRMGSKIK